MAYQVMAILLLLVPWVLVPLGRRLILLSYNSPDDILAKKSLVLFGYISAGLVTISFILDQGSLAALCSLGWVLYCVVLALTGIIRLIKIKETFFSPQLLMEFGLFYLAAGSVWIPISHLGLEPMGFTEPLIILTAVHFHFTGFAACVLTGAVGLALKDEMIKNKWIKNLYVFSAVGVALAMPIIATGFVFSPILKIFWISILSTSLFIVSALTLKILPKINPPIAKISLSISSISILLGMILALIYGLGEYIGKYFILIDMMAYTHGALNAIGFCYFGLLGWVKHLEGKEESHVYHR